MLFRIVTKIYSQQRKQSWITRSTCTQCGQQNIGTTFKSEALTSMNIARCSHCNKKLDNQEHLNKKMEARLSYHKSK